MPIYGHLFLLVAEKSFKIKLRKMIPFSEIGEQLYFNLNPALTLALSV